MLSGLAPLLASLAAVDVATSVRRLQRNVVLYALMLLFLLTAYGALVAAAALAIARHLGAVGALLTVAGGGLLLALVIFLITGAMARADERRKREVATSNSSKALMITAGLSAFPVLVRSRPLAAIAIAGGLGFLAMRSLDVLGPRAGRRDSVPPRPDRPRPR